MMFMKNINTILSLLMAIASQKLVSQILLPNITSLYNNRDNFYIEVVLIIFLNVIAKRYVKS